MDTDYKKAEAIHLEPPDHDDSVEEKCEDCDGRGVHYQRYDLGEGNIKEEDEQCDECEGRGYIFVKPITWEEYVDMNGRGKDD